MFTLLVRLLKKVFGKVLQSHVIVVKIAWRGQVDRGGLELQADLAVDGGLQAPVVVTAAVLGMRSSRRRPAAGTPGGGDPGW